MWRCILQIDNKLSPRQQNLQTILNLLDDHQKLSAKQLASLTGLSIVSINKLLDILDSKSDLIATEFLNTRGRRAKIYKLNYQTLNLGVIQLVEDNNQIKATYFLTDLAGKVQFQQFHDQVITSLEQLTDFIKEQIAKLQPQKIIIGVPGAELDGALQLSDIKPLRGVNLSAAVKDATQIETMVINDANAATFGAAIELNENDNIAVGIYFPKSFGPGVGIVINNRLINGADGLAGEVEYGTVDPQSDISQQIISHAQNIISLLDPNLLIIYAEKLSLSKQQLDQIKQTIQQKFPLHSQYHLDFKRDFEKDYLKGLTTIGRKSILTNLSMT